MQTVTKRDFVLTAEDRARNVSAWEKLLKAFEGDAERIGLKSPDDIPAFTKDARQEYYEEHIARRKANKAKKEAENVRYAG